MSLKFGDKVTVYGKHRGVIIGGIAIHPDLFPHRVATDKLVETEAGERSEFFVRHGEFTEGWD